MPADSRGAHSATAAATAAVAMLAGTDEVPKGEIRVRFVVKGRLSVTCVEYR